MNNNKIIENHKTFNDALESFKQLMDENSRLKKLIKIYKNTNVENFKREFDINFNKMLVTKGLIYANI